MAGNTKNILGKNTHLTPAEYILEVKNIGGKRKPELLPLIRTPPPAFVEDVV